MKCSVKSWWQFPAKTSRLPALFLTSSTFLLLGLFVVDLPLMKPNMRRQTSLTSIFTVAVAVSETSRREALGWSCNVGPRWELSPTSVQSPFQTRAYCDSCWTQKESHEGPDKGSAAQAWQLLMSEKLDNRVYWRPVIQTTQPSSNLSFGPQGKSLITVKMLSSRLLLIILLIKTKSSLKAAKNTKNELILLILLKKQRKMLNLTADS